MTVSSNELILWHVFIRLYCDATHSVTIVCGKIIRRATHNFYNMSSVFAAMIFSFKENAVPLSGVSMFKISAIIGQRSVTLLTNVNTLF